MKMHSVTIVPVDPDRNLKITLKIPAVDKKVAEDRAIAYAEREFAPLKYKLAGAK